MALDIVSEIITATKLELTTLMPDFSQLDYEHDILKNNERGLAKKFGFIPRPANFKDGSAMGFVTMEQEFQLILMDDYKNKDDDTAQSATLNNLYAQVHCVLTALQKKPLALPTAGYRVLLVSGVSIEVPEHFDDNEVVVLRSNFNYTYRYKKN